MSRQVAVVLLVGLPGSGKSSLCQQLVRHQPICRHVCYDELLEPDNLEKWRKARDGILGHVEEMIKDFINGSVERLVLLVDDNFYYQSMRRMYFKMAKRHSIPTCILYLQCDKEVAIQRVHNRKSEGGLSIEDDIIIQMAQKIEPPVEHNWEKFHLLLNSESEIDVSLTWTALENLIIATSKSTLFLKSTPEVPNTACSPSKSETCDLALRKLISTKMQSVRVQGLSSADMSQLAQQLNSQRKFFLKQLSDSSVTDVVDQFRVYVDKANSSVQRDH